VKTTHPTTALSPNSQFGRYEIRSVLGVGGMGDVYLAFDSTLRRQVALKLLPTQFIENKVRRSRFKREAVAASKTPKCETDGGGGDVGTQLITPVGMGPQGGVSIDTASQELRQILGSRITHRDLLWAWPCE